MARSFNGSSDVIRADAARVYSPTAARSICFWVKVPAHANSSETDWVCYSEANTTSINSVFALMSLAATSLTTCRIFIKSSSGTTMLSTNGSKDVWDNTWHHVAYTQDASRNYILYVDGVVDISGSYSTGTVGPNDLALGALVRNTTGNFFPGRLAGVANWLRQITAGEVASMAAGMPASHFGPSHYWPLWGADSPEPDIGISSHTAATLTGTAFASGGRESLDLITA